MPEYAYRGAPFVWKDTAASTNDIVRAMARDGAPEFAAAAADSQFSGRGREGRAFFSPPGQGLYLSVLLRPRLPLARQSALTPLAAVATARAVEEIFPDAPVQVKWVNDLLLSGKKFCGILVESGVDMAGERFAVVGVGVNLTTASFPAEFASRATSLAREGYREKKLREHLAEGIMQELRGYERSLTAVGRRELLADYRVRLALIGQWLTAYAAGSLGEGEGEPLCEGICEGVDEDFSLLLREDGGALHRLREGEVRARGK